MFRTIHQSGDLYIFNISRNNLAIIYLLCDCYCDVTVQIILRPKTANVSMHELYLHAPGVRFNHQLIFGFQMVYEGEDNPVIWLEFRFKT